MSDAVLWHKSSYYMCEIDIFALVKILLTRCVNKITANFFPKDADKILIRLFQKTSRPEILIMIIGLISKYCNTSSTSKVNLTRQTFIFLLVETLRNAFCEVEYERRKIEAAAKKYNSALFRQEELVRRSELAQKITGMLLYFSCGPKPCIDGFLTEDVSKDLSDLVDWRHSGICTMSAKAKLQIEELLLHKLLIGLKEHLSEEVSNQIFQCFGFPEEFALTQKAYVLDLSDTNGQDDVYIQDELLKFGFVAKTTQVGLRESKAVHEDWTDIRVQTVLSPCQFWVLFGDKSKCLVDEIGSALNQSLMEDQLLEKYPQIGDLIFVGKDERGPYRACVLDVDDGEKMVQVFSLDYGFIKVLRKSQWLFKLDEKLKQIPPQAVYCELKGVINRPDQVFVTENLLSVFCNLTCAQDFAYASLAHPHLHTVLMSWALCDSPTLATKALRILSNLARNPEVKGQLGQLGLVEMILGLCKTSQNALDAPSARERVELSLGLLANLLHENNANKKRLIATEGVESLILQHLSAESTVEPVRAAALRVLRVFVGYSQLHQYCGETATDSKPVSSPTKNSNTVSRTPARVAQGLSGSSSSDSKSSSIEANPGNCSTSPSKASTQFPGIGQRLGALQLHQPEPVSSPPSSNTQRTVQESPTGLVASPVQGMGRGAALLAMAAKNTGKPGMVQPSGIDRSSGNRRLSSGVHEQFSDADAFKQNQSPSGKRLSKNDSETKSLQSTSKQLHNGTDDRTVSASSEVFSDSDGGEFIKMTRRSGDSHKLPGLNSSRSLPERGSPDGGDSDISSGKDGKGLKNRSSLRKADSYQYVQDEVVPFTSDSTHELMSSTSDIRKVYVDEMLEILTGFINSRHGGALYYGIRKSGTIFGLRLSRDQKDEFRIGIDKTIVRKMKPLLLATQYELSFKSVFRKIGASGTLEVIPDLYVIEISIPSGLSGSIFTCNNTCYLRNQSMTEIATKQTINRLSVEEEEGKYLQDIRYLEREIAIKRKSLNMD